MLTAVAFAAGAIDSAPTLATVLSKVLDFLLSVLGVVAIIGLVLAGLIYVGARGDEKSLRTAKKAVTFGLIGIVVALAALVIVKQLVALFP